ncbi:MAG: DUF420 domain-containing protein [Verrucomicrobiota bacterium]
MENFDFPLLNSTLNALSALLLVIGLIFIKRDKKIAHRNTMIAATTVSGLFLISYLTYHAIHGSTKFTHEGSVRFIYFYIILWPHVILAVVNLPMIIITLKHAIQGNFEKHKRIARWTWGIWIYVSVSGVLVYMMLYQWFPPIKG